MVIRTALILALTLTAESSTEREAAAHKQAWEWSLEERIAVRTDPAARRARVAAYEDRREKGTTRTMTADAAWQQRMVDRLEGRDHPELFLPVEVLGNFVLIAYGFGADEFAVGVREQAMSAAAKAGLPSDFLQVFERETADLVPLYAEEMRLRDRLANGGTQAAPGAWERIIELGAQQCPLRAAALGRLRAMYGKSLDRFLYEYVASRMSRGYFGEPPTADELRRTAEGCR